MKTPKMLKKDWCTAFPEGNWGDCCQQHDYDYADGTEKDTAFGRYMHRLVSDANLYACVKQRKGPAKFMYCGVRIFGYFHYRNTLGFRIKHAILDWIKK